MLRPPSVTQGRTNLCPTCLGEGRLYPPDCETAICGSHLKLTKTPTRPLIRAEDFGLPAAPTQIFWNARTERFETPLPQNPRAFQRATLVNGIWKAGGSSVRTTQLLAENERLWEFVNSIEKPIELE